MDVSELYIKKVGSSLILSPVENGWDGLKESLLEFSEDFMSEGRIQPPVQKREDF